MPRYPKVMLVLRDYRECLLRHHQSLCGVGRLTSPTLSPSALLKPEWTTSKNSVRPDAAVHRNRRDEPVELAAPMTLGRHTPGSPVRQGDRSRRHRLHE